MIRNRLFALIFRICAFVFALVGVLSHVNLASGFNPGMFMYYTIQSNWLAVILFGLLVYRTAKGLKQDGKTGNAGYFARFEMVCVIDLLLTLIVYWAMLAPQAFAMGSEFSLWTFENLSVHMVTPLLCLVDYLLFAPSGHMKYRDVYYVLIYPLFYVVFSSVAGLLGYSYRISSVDDLPVRFPYFFFDYDRIGAQSILYILGLVAFFLVLSHGLYWFDKKVKKPDLGSKKEG